VLPTQNCKEAIIKRFDELPSARKKVEAIKA